MGDAFGDGEAIGEGEAFGEGEALGVGKTLGDGEGLRFAFGLLLGGAAVTSETPMTLKKRAVRIDPANLSLSNIAFLFFNCYHRKRILKPCQGSLPFSYNENMTIFSTEVFIFPYDYHFPGQGSDEYILFVTRENAVMLWVRRLGVVASAVAVAFVTSLAGSLLSVYNAPAANTLQGLGAVSALLMLIIGWWWVTTLWKKSLMLVTTQRLLKFINTTPFNRHVLSLPLEMVVDTGSYTKGLVQAIFKLGTFTARSSAASSGVATDDERQGRINKKYFYIENVAAYEDLQHYVNKLLQAYRNHREDLPSFRPFLPGLKGEKRKQFMEQFPGFWS